MDLKDFHLQNINLQVKEGDYHVLIGPTGSGKSVLLETIAGFYKPNKGQIILEGIDITSLNPEDRGISIVYQDYVLFPHMNVFENIAYGVKKKISYDKSLLESMVYEMAKKLKIDHLLKRDTKTLSGGEKQRTAIARSLIVEPKLLLMDEPFSAVDVNTQTYLTNLIKNVLDEYQTTCIHVSHNFNDVWSLAEQVAVLNDGIILQQGMVTDVFSKPCHNFVADFVGVQNIFEGEVINASREITEVRINQDLVIKSSDTYSEDEKNVIVAIRPENIVFSNKPFISSIRNQYKGIITDIIHIGPTVWIEVDIKGNIFKGIITPSSSDLLGIEKGKEIYLSFKSVNVKILDGNHSFNSSIKV